MNFDDCYFRIGIVFSVSSDETKNGLNDAGVAVLNMFNFIQIDSGNDVALKTVNTMFAELKNRDELSVE